MKRWTDAVRWKEELMITWMDALVHGRRDEWINDEMYTGIERMKEGCVGVVKHEKIYRWMERWIHAWITDDCRWRDEEMFVSIQRTTGVSMSSYSCVLNSTAMQGFTLLVVLYTLTNVYSTVNVFALCKSATYCPGLTLTADTVLSSSGQTFEWVLSIW